MVEALRIRSAAVSLAVSMALAIGGCATDPSGQQLGDRVDDGSSVVPVPAFSGPWASDFTDAYQRATTDFERLALADELISDAEFAEMENSFTRCLEEKGITFSGFTSAGGYDFDFPPATGSEKANTETDACSASAGNDTIGSLYFAMVRNPQNADEATIMAACLSAAGAVPSGYGASDYDRDAQQSSFPFLDEDAGGLALQNCAADPLGLVAGSR